jgi:hypothetical protein
LARCVSVKKLAALSARSSVTVSTAQARDIRCAARPSAAVGAEIEPVTISPAWVIAL